MAQTKNELTLLDHLSELRRRFFFWLTSLFMASLLGYALHPQLLNILAALTTETLYYNSPAGAFETVLSLAIGFGFILTTPILLFEAASFMTPALPHPPAALRSSLLLIVLALILSVCGLAFAYYLVLPQALRFLTQFGGTQLNPLFTAQSYFTFITRYLAAFALIFQLPLVVYFIAHHGAVRPAALLRALPYVILLSFVIGAILTPTADIYNQSLMALPIIVLYLVSTVVVHLTRNLTNRTNLLS